jgi:GT2 family glycosyltransferase
VSDAAPSPTVSVCLLNYAGERFLDRCLDALERLDPPPLEIIAVDNASPDGSLARLSERAGSARGPAITVVPAGANRGYAGGHNLGARRARGDYLAFLNATVEVEPGWLEVVPWLEAHPEVAFVQPAVFHRDDPSRLESLGTLLTPYGSLRVVGRNHRESRPAPGGLYASEVLSVLGAVFVARRSVFEALGGFDESLFMYFEESDLCWRGWLQGHRSACWFDPDRPTRAFHTAKGTVPRSFPVQRFFERNRTLAMVRNLEARNLWKVGVHVTQRLVESARDPKFLVRYLGDLAEGTGPAARRRPRLQGDRTVPDRTLFGLRAPEDLERRFVAPPPQFR